MLRWALSCLLLAAGGPPLDVAVDPRPGASFGLALSGPAGGAGSGEFRGGVRLDGSPIEMPLSGRAERNGDRLRLVATVRYADVPAEWSGRFRPDAFDYRIRADVAGSGAVGADLDAELSGSLTLRLPAGDLAVPFAFLGRLGTDGARSGVFSHPDGATSLSPQR